MTRTVQHSHQSPPAPIPFTKEAYAKLKNDIQALVVEREAVMERLKIAREMGDLSENGAYKYAKFELGNISRELRRLRPLLENGYIQDKTLNSSQVEFGSTVTIEKDGQTKTFMMVSQHESNPPQGKLSIESPLGSQLLHKKVGDQVTVKAPVGQTIYSIVEIT